LPRIKKIQQLNSQNAIHRLRDTPDKIAIAKKLMTDIDKARPEVVIQVEVLRPARIGCGILGSFCRGSRASIAFNPPAHNEQ